MSFFSFFSFSAPETPSVIVGKPKLMPHRIGRNTNLDGYHRSSRDLHFESRFLIAIHLVVVMVGVMGSEGS